MERPIVCQDGFSIEYRPTAEEVGFGGVATHHLQVLKSAAGYYIGTLYNDEDGYWYPYSRDSENYYDNREIAEKALINNDYIIKF